MNAGEGAAREIPLGTVCLLFTDIEASTARWEKHRAAMAQALRKHNELLAAAIESRDGYVFKTVGDAICAAFDTAASAINAAFEAQQALNSHDWSGVGGLRVRMAVHAGTVESHDGDYFGPTVNRVARLLSIAHGGQILVSGIAKELGEDTLLPTLALRDLGSHRLRDLAHPEQVYQLVAPDLTDAFPPLRSLERLPNNLPLQLTPFIGRQTELGTIDVALQQARLVTLVGAGGVGKTRLSLQTAADSLDTFTDGVWFVDLAVVRDEKQVPGAIAQVVNAHLDASIDPLSAVTAALRTSSVLLVLDNCEHVIEGAAAAALAILRDCPNVRILATSRQGLGIPGERVIRVPSLAVPERGALLSTNRAATYGAIALFADRAAAASETFTLTDANVDTVAEICRQLDGIALAIELAAARLRVLSLEQLAARLNERLRLLTGGSRTVLPRQQTMRALIDWSYDLLSDAERSMFRRASVFTGSFSIDAAERICGEEQPQAWDAFGVLADLVDKSMITAELHEQGQRYRLLESTRQYAFERFALSGEEAAIRRRHAEYFRAFAEDAERRYYSTPLNVWLREMDPDADNLRAAIDWCIEQENDLEMGARTLAAFMWYWMHSKRIMTPIAMMDKALAVLPANSRVAARLEYSLAYLWETLRQEPRAKEAAQRSLAIAEALNDRECVAQALCALGSSQYMELDYDCEPLFVRAIEIFTELGNRRMVGFALGRRARCLGVRSRLAEALPLYERALSMARIAGDERTCAQVLNNLAEAEFNWNGDSQKALRYAGEAIEYAMAARMEGFLAATYLNMVAYFLAEGNVDDAYERARLGLHISRDLQNEVSTSFAAISFAAIASRRGDHATGAVLAAYFLTWFRKTFGEERPLEATEQALYASIVALAGEHLTGERANEALREGANLTRDEAVQLMLAM